MRVAKIDTIRKVITDFCSDQCNLDGHIADTTPDSQAKKKHRPPKEFRRIFLVAGACFALAPAGLSLRRSSRAWSTWSTQLEGSIQIGDDQARSRIVAGTRGSGSIPSRIAS